MALGCGRPRPRSRRDPSPRANRVPIRRSGRSWWSNSGQAPHAKLITGPVIVGGRFLLWEPRPTSVVGEARTSTRSGRKPPRKGRRPGQGHPARHTERATRKTGGTREGRGRLRRYQSHLPVVFHFRLGWDHPPVMHWGSVRPPSSVTTTAIGRSALIGTTGKDLSSAQRERLL